MKLISKTNEPVVDYQQNIIQGSEEGGSKRDMTHNKEALFRKTQSKVLPIRNSIYQCKHVYPRLLMSTFKNLKGF